MLELKKISPEAVPGALAKAERYRLLNQSSDSVSICLDILEVEPENQKALITLLLALTDQFSTALHPAFERATEVLKRLGDAYCKSYYAGIIYERRAKAHLRSDRPGAGRLAHEWFTRAMAAYDEAFLSCQPGNQESVLRWNACARILNDNPDVKPAETTSEVEVYDAFDQPH